MTIKSKSTKAEANTKPATAAKTVKTSDSSKVVSKDSTKKTIKEKNVKANMLKEKARVTNNFTTEISIPHLPVFNIKDKANASIEDKLLILYSIQMIDSEIDRINIMKGELPLEVEDIEDEIVGLTTRIEKNNAEVQELENQVNLKKNKIKESKALIKKYETQLQNVRNNREYESLTKEIEYQNLDIKYEEKKINEFKLMIDTKNEAIQSAEKELSDKKEEVNNKKKELNEITSENIDKMNKLSDMSIDYQKLLDERLLSAYIKIRKNAKNGLSIVKIQRDSCGGCFNKIPPQRQLEIKMHKKIIVCEYCGRILIDDSISEKLNSIEN